MHGKEWTDGQPLMLRDPQQLRILAGLTRARPRHRQGHQWKKRYVSRAPLSPASYPHCYPHGKMGKVSGFLLGYRTRQDERAHHFSEQKSLSFPLYNEAAIFLVWFSVWGPHPVGAQAVPSSLARSSLNSAQGPCDAWGRARRLLHKACASPFNSFLGLSDISRQEHPWPCPLCK